MNFAILARMSNESKRRKRKKQREQETDSVPDYNTGADIDTRERQVIRVTRTIEARGGSVVDVYDEPHTSAWKRRKITEADGTVRYEVKRPVYRQALADLKRGISKSGKQLDGLFAVEIDRVTRDNRDLEDAIDACTHSGRPILDLSGTLDLLSDNGRTQARVIVSFKNGQSADTARRVHDMHETLQEAGIPTGGNRPFGWLDDKRTLHPVEGRELAQAARDIIGGATKGGICARWNRAGLLTVNGKKWTTTNFTWVLRNPRIAGIRSVTQKRGENGTGSAYMAILRDEAGNPVKGDWEAAITQDEYTTLIEIIGEAPEAGSAHNARKYLGNGTLRCGKDGCDCPTRGRKSPPSAKKAPGHFQYVCPSTAMGGCAGIAIDGVATDQAIKELVLAKWEKEAANRSTAQQPAEWDGQVKLDRLRENMAALKRARNAEPPLITADRYYQDLSEYEASERVLIRERNRFLKKARQAASAPVDLRADWDSLSLAEKRDYVSAVLTSILVLPAKGRRNVPVQERLVPIWRNEDED